MTVYEAVDELDGLQIPIRGGHYEADHIIMRFLVANGFLDVVLAYERVKERDGGWRYS